MWLLNEMVPVKHLAGCLAQSRCLVSGNWPGRSWKYPHQYDPQIPRLSSLRSRGALHPSVFPQLQPLPMPTVIFWVSPTVILWVSPTVRWASFLPVMIERQPLLRSAQPVKIERQPLLCPAHPVMSPGPGSQNRTLFLCGLKLPKVFMKFFSH